MTLIQIVLIIIEQDSFLRATLLVLLEHNLLHVELSVGFFAIRN